MAECHKAVASSVGPKGIANDGIILHSSNCVVFGHIPDFLVIFSFLASEEIISYVCLVRSMTVVKPSPLSSNLIKAVP